jgi:DNA-directed RNA polymerase specialized sigma24 family protein
MVTLDELDDLYAALSPSLRRTLAFSFPISDMEAQAVVLEAFLGCLTFMPPGWEPSDWITRLACENARGLALAQAGPPALPEPPEPPGAERSLELYVLYERALGTLPGKQRQALTMLLIESKSYFEIAAELDVTVVYAKKLIRAAAAHLRKWAKE